MPRKSFKRTAPLSRRQMFIHFCVEFAAKAETSEQYCDNQLNVSAAKLTQTSIAKSKKVDSDFMARVRSQEFQELLFNARSAFESGGDLVDVEALVRSELQLPEREYSKMQPAICYVALVPPEIVRVKAKITTHDLLVGKKKAECFPIVEGDVLDSALNAALVPAQEALKTGDNKRFYRITMHAEDLAAKMNELLLANNGWPSIEAEPIRTELLKNLIDAIGDDDDDDDDDNDKDDDDNNQEDCHKVELPHAFIEKAITKTHTFLACYVMCLICKETKDIKEKGLKNLSMSHFDVIRGFSVPIDQLWWCGTCQKLVSYKQIYEIENSCFVVNGSTKETVYPDIELALTMFFPEVVTIGQTSFFRRVVSASAICSNGVIDAALNFVTDKVGGPLLVIKGLTTSGWSELSPKFLPENGIGYKVDAVHYSLKKPAGMPDAESNNRVNSWVPIPRPGMQCDRLVEIRLIDLPDAKPQASKIKKLDDLYFLQVRAEKHPNHVPAWLEDHFPHEIQACWLNCLLAVIQFFVFERDEGFLQILEKNATEELKVMISTLKANQGYPSVYSENQRQALVQNYLEKRLSRKLGLANLLQPQSLVSWFEVCIQCKAEISAMPAGIKNASIEVLNQMISLEIPDNFTYRCKTSGCEGSAPPVKKIIFEIYKEGFVVSGIDKEGHSSMNFPKLEEALSLYPEVILLGGQTFYRRIAIVVENYKTLETHAFCVKTEQVAGPLMRVCDSKIETFAERFENKDSVYSYFINAAFYSAQSPKPVEQTK